MVTGERHSIPAEAIHSNRHNTPGAIVVDLQISHLSSVFKLTRKEKKIKIMEERERKKKKKNFSLYLFPPPNWEIGNGPDQGSR